MTDHNELTSHPSAARHGVSGESDSAGALADVEIPPTFDRSLSTLVRQLEAMTVAGWVTTAAEPSGECR
ncbi:hypothetical protein ACFU44_16085 [Nocardia rhizosphaerihabitans]|uniref:hypothetical protein n=1 Tax=Nocardia rhizosphaerihabitans TaxID=1691570 RepID=UPI00367363FB